MFYEAYHVMDSVAILLKRDVVLRVLVDSKFHVAEVGIEGEVEEIEVATESNGVFPTDSDVVLTPFVNARWNELSWLLYHSYCYLSACL